MVRVEWVEGGDDDPTHLRFEGDEKNESRPQLRFGNHEMQLDVLQDVAPAKEAAKEAPRPKKVRKASEGSWISGRFLG